MTARTRITIASETQRRAQARAAELGISVAEYVRGLVLNDFEVASSKFDISTMFDLIDEGPPTDVTRDKDKMIGEAVWAEYRKTKWR